MKTITRIKRDIFLHCTLGGFADAPDKVINERFLTPSEINIIQKELKRSLQSNGRVKRYTWILIATKLNKSNPSSLKVLYNRYYKRKWDLT